MIVARLFSLLSVFLFAEHFQESCWIQMHFKEATKDIERLLGLAQQSTIPLRSLSYWKYYDEIPVKKKGRKLSAEIIGDLEFKLCLVVSLVSPHPNRQSRIVKIFLRSIISHFVKFALSYNLLTWWNFCIFSDSPISRFNSYIALIYMHGLWMWIISQLPTMATRKQECLNSRFSSFSCRFSVRRMKLRPVFTSEKKTLTTEFYVCR